MSTGEMDSCKGRQTAVTVGGTLHFIVQGHFFHYLLWESEGTLKIDDFGNHDNFS